MTRYITVAVLALSILFLSRAGFAEDTASTLAKKLESQLLASAGVSMSFTSGSEGHVTLKADLNRKRVRLETANVLILSDGKTIWNINKKTNHVTIDGVGAHSPFKDPAALFRFSENYLPQLQSHAGSRYTLELIPSKDLSDLFAQTGKNQELQLSLRMSGKSVRILSARAVSSNGQSSTGPVSISTLKSTRAADFEFQRTPGMKIVDLRE